MSKYLVRIELHKPTVNAPYERLHEIMGKAGFKRTVVTDGVEYHLPDAEYLGESSKNLTGVRDEVKSLAAQVPANESASILVVPFGAYAGAGLKRVEKEPVKNLATYVRELTAQLAKK